MEFWQAIKMLEAKYGLPPLPWSGSEKGEQDQTEAKVKQALQRDHQTIEQVFARIDRLIDSCCRERSVIPDQCAAWWEARDKVAYLYGKEQVPESTAKAAAHRILDAVLSYMGVFPTP